MKPDLSDKVTSKIEAMCELGCSHVNQLLKQANNGHEIEELDKIMAIYEVEK